MSAAGDLEDGRLLEEIAEKLKGHRGIRFTQLASHAQGLGRKGLAALLLDLESSAAEQVPLLLKLGEVERALKRAVESGDTDLVFLVLFAMHRTLPLPDFAKALSARPRVCKLFLAYCAQVEPELFQQLCKSMGRYEDLAGLKIQQSLRVTNDEARLRGGTGRRVNALPMSECMHFLEQAADLYGQTREHGFQAKAASEFARLRKFQADLEEETGNACFVGLSVVGTAQQCVRLGNMRAANRVQAEFRLSERRFWWLKAKVYASLKDWEALLSMALEKKSPAGCEPCIGLVKEHGAPDIVIARFIAKLPDGKKKAEEYTAIKMYREAAETAAKSRDSDMLSKIQGLVGGTSPLGLAVTQIKDRLQQTGR